MLIAKWSGINVRDATKVTQQRIVGVVGTAGNCRIVRSLLFGRWLLP